MTDDQTTRPAARGGAFSGVVSRDKHRTPDTGGPPRDAAFEQRVAMQQFLNENGPIIEALSRQFDSTRDVMAQEGALKVPAETAKNLAVEIARRVTGKETPDPKDVRVFRHAAASVVASDWAEDRRTDVAEAAAQVAAMMALADPALDLNPFADGGPGPDTTVRMTACSVALALLKPVMDYDFRRDKRTLVDAMTNAVLEVAVAAAREMLPDDTPANDRRMMLQTLSNRLAGVMQACYERHVRNTLVRVSRMPADQKEAWLRANDPLPEILRSFREWSVFWTGSAIAYAKGVNAAVKPQAERDAVPA